MADFFPKLLDRDFARAQIAEIRELAGPLLGDVIDEGVGVFERCSQTAPGGDANLGVLFPFHHLLEMADGVHVLLEEAAVAASQPVLRSAFEALVGLKYVLAEDTEHRGLAYVVADVKERLRWYDSMDAATQRGKQYRKDMELDLKPDYPLPPIEKVRRSRANLESMLAAAPFRPHAEEFERLRKQRGRPPHWYSLYDGPVTFRDLAERTGDLDDYLVLYSQWSKTTHAVDLIRQLGRHEGKATVRVIRAPGGIEQRYLFAIHFVLEATRLVLRHYRNGEFPRYARWYQESISARLAQLQKVVTNEDYPSTSSLGMTISCSWRPLRGRCPSGSALRPRRLLEQASRPPADVTRLGRQDPRRCRCVGQNCHRLVNAPQVEGAADNMGNHASTQRSGKCHC